MSTDTNLTAEEKKALRNFAIWFLVKVGLYYAIQVAITKYLEREYGTTDPAKIQSRIKAKEQAQSSPSKIIMDGIVNPSFEHMKEQS